jgi:methyltransferase (TIGR00027 family)
VRDESPSSSAQTVALCRAHLTWMGVLDDVLAASMLRTRSKFTSYALRYWPLTRLGRSPTFSFLAARTCFFDHAVNAALDDGLGQVAVIGAGYDSRAWRLARPGVRFFEVDHPATQHDKRQRAPAGGPCYVAADLRVDRLTELLPAAGFDRAIPTVFVVEGLTMYLSEAVVTMVLCDLASLAASGSRLAVNFTVRGGGSVSVVSRAIAKAVRTTWRMRGEPVHGWVRPEALSGLLFTAGWALREAVIAPDLAERYLAGSSLSMHGLNPGAICVSAVPS